MRDNNPFEYYFECINCKRKYSADEVTYFCSVCKDLLDLKFNYNVLKNIVNSSVWMEKTPNVWSYKDLLPIKDFSKRVTLNEGGTGLHICDNLGKYLILNRFYVKNEGENPTGSFKDRGMTVGASKAVELGKKKVICASTGNTSSSLAAYSAKAGLECFVLIPEGKVTLGKITQAMVYGAKIVEIRGNFDDALRSVLYIANTYDDIYLLNSINPYRIEGQKTLAFEIWGQLNGEIPDVVIVPVGNAGNIRAIWKGFTELQLLDFADKLPRMIGVQASGASPIAYAYEKGLDEVKIENYPETVATAIRIGSPVNWRMALKAVKDSKGSMETVTDDEILKAQSILAGYEGLFVEPASAASIAGCIKLVDKDLVDKDESVVCVTTGHGLKDPKIIETSLPQPLSVEDDIEKIILALDLS